MSQIFSGYGASLSLILSPSPSHHSYGSKMNTFTKGQQVALTFLHRSFCDWKGHTWSHLEQSRNSHGTFKEQWWSEFSTDQEGFWHQTNHRGGGALCLHLGEVRAWAPGSPLLLLRKGLAVASYINQENHQPVLLSCSLPMCLPLALPTKGRRVWKQKREKQHRQQF